MIKTTVDLETIKFEDSPLTNRPGTLIGYRANGSPIYTIGGGSVDVELDDDEDDSDDDEESDDDNDDKDEWVPPSKSEFEKLLAAKSKADSEAAARKRFLRDAGFDPKTGKAVSKPQIDLDDEDTDDDTESVVHKTPTQVDSKKIQRDLQRQLEREVSKAEIRERERALTLVSAVPEALAEADLNPKYLKRALKFMDLDSVEVDSDGEVDGLLEQIDELKNDFPEFFKRTRMRDAAKDAADTKVVGGSRRKAPESKDTASWQDQIAQAIARGGN